MSNDQKDSPNKKQEKGEPYNIQAHESFHVLESPTVQLSQISEYLKKRVWLLIVLIGLNLFSGAMCSWSLIYWWPREGWSSFVISLAINGIGFFIGYAALMKIQEIRIAGNQRG